MELNIVRWYVSFNSFFIIRIFKKHKTFDNLNRSADKGVLITYLFQIRQGKENCRSHDSFIFNFNFQVKTL